MNPIIIHDETKRPHVHNNHLYERVLTALFISLTRDWSGLGWLTNTQEKCSGYFYFNILLVLIAKTVTKNINFCYSTPRSRTNISMRFLARKA